MKKRKELLSKIIVALIAAVLLPIVIACADGEKMEPIQAQQETADAQTETHTTGSTEKPAETLDEEWFIEEAWKVAERFEEAHGVQLKKDGAFIVYSSSPLVSFPDSDNLYRLYVNFKRGENGCEPDYELSYLSPANESGEDYLAWYRKTGIDALISGLDNAEIVVTAEEIEGSGCAEAEHLDAIGSLFIEKLIEYYKALPESSPLYCYEIKPIAFRHEEDAGGTFYEFEFAVRAQEPFAYTECFIDRTMLGSSDYAQGIDGWLLVFGMQRLTKTEDGNFVGSASLGLWG